MKKKARVYFPVVLACISLFAMGWMDNARGPFYPFLLNNTGVNSTLGAFFFALTSFVSILSAASAGVIITRFGLKTLLLLGAASLTLCPFGLVFLPNYEGSIVTAFIFGLGLGWTAVGQNILISLVERPDLKRRLFSLLHCFYALSAMTAPISVVYLQKYFEWNYLLTGVVVLGLPFLVGSLFIERVKKAPEEKIEPPPLTDFWAFTWVLFLSFYISSELILSTRMVVLVETYGFSFEKASSHLFYFFLMMFFSRVSFFAFKINVKAYYLLIGCLGGAFASYIFGAFANTYFYALVGGFMGPIFPIVLDEMATQWPKKFDVLISRTIAISSIFIVSAHIFVGVLTDFIGIQKAVLSVPLLLIFAIITLVTATQLEKNKGYAKSRN